MSALDGPVGSWRHGGPALGSWRRGELGSRPVIGAMLVLWLAFQAINPNFLSPDNLVNLSMQMVALGVTTLGVVLVLVAGEIDLSVGAVNGLASAVLAVTFVQQGWPLAIALAAAILVGAAIGLVHGALSARLGLPSFVVTTEIVFAGPGERLIMRHDPGMTPHPYVDGTLLAIRQVAEVVGLRRGLDSLLFDASNEH